MVGENEDAVHSAQGRIGAISFSSAEITCLALAEKIRAHYQRNKARDIYDLGMFATVATRPAAHRPGLWVLKLWQARDNFDPAPLMQQKFEDGRMGETRAAPARG